MEKKGKAKANEFAEEASEKYQKYSQEASEKFHEYSEEASDKYQKARKVTKQKGHEGKEKASEAGRELNENRDNPVVIGNAMVIAAGSAALGYGAYTKYAKGELSWEIIGVAAGAVALFAVADYHLSS